MSARQGWSVGTPTLIYAWTEDKGEFDRIALPEQTFDWKPCEVTTLLKRDGRQWERRVHAKELGEIGGGQPTVIFQFFEERAAEPAAAPAA